jgi:hypothetical protein
MHQDGDRNGSSVHEINIALTAFKIRLRKKGVETQPLFLLSHSGLDDLYLTFIDIHP